LLSPFKSQLKILKMEKISLTERHTKETFLYAGSRMFERASYYGMRSILVLYMINGSLQMTEENAVTIYSWLITSLLFSQILGAVLGDLLLGSKRALVIGGVLQALGTFILCYTSVQTLFIGMALIVLGGGLYTPNIMAHYGKLYLNKTRLLDSGFTMLYTAVNIGAIIGSLVIVYLGSIDFLFGFITSGVLMMLSLLLPLLIKEKTVLQETNHQLSINRRILCITMAFLLLGIFWGVYEFGSNGIIYCELRITQNPNLNLAPSLWSSLGPAFALLAGVILSIVWSYFFTDQLTKLTIGFLLAAVSFAILLIIPENPAAHHFLIFLISVIVFSIAEIFLAPILHSVLTQNTNPKYLAIIMSLAFIPSRIFGSIAGLLIEKTYNEPILSLIAGTIVMGISGIGLAILIIVLKNKKTINASES
jgi:proton-dependent oligopeptide transporter, POT family